MRKMIAGLVAAVCVSPAFSSDEINHLESRTNSAGWLSTLMFWGWRDQSQEAQEEDKFSGQRLKDHGQTVDMEWVLFPKEEDWEFVSGDYSFRSMNKLPIDGNFEQNIIYTEESGNVLRFVVAIDWEDVSPLLPQNSSIIEDTYELRRLVSREEIFFGTLTAQGGALRINDLKSPQTKSDVLNMLKKGGIIR